MGIICGAEARLVVAIQSLAEETDLLIPMKTVAPIVKTHQWTGRSVMSAPDGPNRRHLTQAARDAAAAARRAKAMVPHDSTAPQVFIIRLASFPMPFGWEIRRFGGLVLSRSDMGFPSMASARSAGEGTLAAMVPA